MAPLVHTGRAEAEEEWILQPGGACCAHAFSINPLATNPLPPFPPVPADCPASLGFSLWASTPFGFSPSLASPPQLYLYLSGPLDVRGAHHYLLSQSSLFILSLPAPLSLGSMRDLYTPLGRLGVSAMGATSITGNRAQGAHILAACRLRRRQTEA